MNSRRLARRIALDVLFQADIRDILPDQAWALSESSGWSVGDSSGQPGGGPPPEPPPAGALDYALQVVSGVQRDLATIDARIEEASDSWTIGRMPTVDRSLLRIAVFELLSRDDVPVAVIINEAVDLAKEYSTQDSGRFVNGILGRIAEGRARAD